MTTAEDFDDTPTRITWDTGSSGTTITAGNTKVSDEIVFTFTKTNRHGIHIYMADRDNMKYVASGYDGYYYDEGGSGDLTMTAAWTVDGLDADGVAVADLVEVYVY